MTQTYTYILELDGGTFVSQVVAGGIKQSAENWFVELKTNETTRIVLSEKVIDQIKLSLNNPESGIVPLSGLTNVWFDNLETDLGNRHLHIILTEENES